MKKKGHTPITKVKNPEPEVNDPDWVIWAAWADRITFEEIEKKTGKTETEVIKIMRRSVKPTSFRLWRKKELIKKVLNTEKNLNILEKKLLVKLKRMIIYKI
ncbi:TIGR03643 family protein [Candidatus Pelagibacter sp.]|nr:TIGR03643 family protein [Candidatus Pelagibacter sp.]